MKNGIQDLPVEMCFFVQIVFPSFVYFKLYSLPFQGSTANQIILVQLVSPLVRGLPNL